MADNYGNGDGSAGLKPDNSEHTFCWTLDYTGDNPREKARDSMLYLENRTTMTRNFVDGLCSNSIDAVFDIEELGGKDGEWRCLERIDGTNKCQQSRLAFDRSQITSGDDWRQTTCHEIGHSVGLAHGEGNDCMGSSSFDHNYTDHHRDHINNDRF